MAIGFTSLTFLVRTGFTSRKKSIVLDTDGYFLKHRTDSLCQQKVPFLKAV